jgi:hypothetical protein
MEGAIHGIYYRPLITVLVQFKPLPFMTLPTHVKLLRCTCHHGALLVLHDYPTVSEAYHIS